MKRDERSDEKNAKGRVEGQSALVIPAAEAHKEWCGEGGH
jgi:hypothetical protein